MIQDGDHVPLIKTWVQCLVACDTLQKITHFVSYKIPSCKKNTTEPWHTHLGNTIFGITKAADLFFGILIVVSALLLGQELSNECQKKPPYQLFCTFSMFAVEELTLNWASNRSIHSKMCSFGFSCELGMDKMFGMESVVLCLQELCTLDFHNFHEQMYFVRLQLLNPGALFAMTQVWLWIIHMIGLGPWMSCHRRFGFLVMFVVELIMRDGPLDFWHIWFAGHFNNAQCSFYQTLFSVPKSEPLCIHNIKWE